MVFNLFISKLNFSNVVNSFVLAVVHDLPFILGCFYQLQMITLSVCERNSTKPPYKSQYIYISCINFNC